MSNIIWSDEYSVGRDDFDFHHKKIFSIISNLREALDKNLTTELNYLLDELKNYSKYHLGKEEDFLVANNYPDLEKHKKIHQLYNKRIQDFLSKKGKLDLNEVLDFLESWWLNHILKEDKKYGEFFTRKGI